MERDLQGESLKAGMFQAVQALVENVARRQPIVLVCEDMHWADPTSLELLERLLPLVDRVPLLFLCVFRPETEHGCWRIKETGRPAVPPPAHRPVARGALGRREPDPGGQPAAH